MQTPIYLGTIALEPNRWSTRVPSIDASVWTDRATGSGFDGVELWEPHFRDADADVQARMRERRDAVAIFNTYLLPENGTDEAWAQCADTCQQLEVQAVKFNFGRDRERSAEYVSALRRVQRFFPPEIQLLCECHPGTVAEQPEDALALLSEPGLEHMQIICHPFLIGEAKLERWISCFGSRIGHVHVQVRNENREIIRVKDRMDHVRRQISLLSQHGYAGSWTVEFVYGTSGADDVPELLFQRACEDRSVLASVLDVAGNEG